MTLHGFLVARLYSLLLTTAFLVASGSVHSQGVPSEPTLLRAQTLLNERGLGRDIQIDGVFARGDLPAPRVRVPIRPLAHLVSDRYHDFRFRLLRTFAYSKIDDKDSTSNHLALPQPGQTIDQVQLYLWLKVFMVLSSVYRVPITEIQMSTTVGMDVLNCTYTLWIQNGSIDFIGPQKNVELCSPGSDFTSVPLEVQVADYEPARIASGIDIMVPAEPLVSSITQVIALAQKFFQQYKVTSQPGPQSSRFAVIDAYGLKDAVLVGEKRWETVRFCISDISRPFESNLHLLIVSDGYYASGIGGPPPVTGYSNSLEPAYRKQLEDFTSTFGQCIRANIGKR